MTEEKSTGVFLFSPEKGKVYMANLDVRFKAKAAGVPLWKIAKDLGVSDMTLFRRLRKELSVEEKSKLYAVIQKLAVEQAKADLERVGE